MYYYNNLASTYGEVQGETKNILQDRSLDFTMGAKKIVYETTVLKS